MAPLPKPDWVAQETSSQLASLLADQPQPSPVFTKMRPSLSPGSAVALVAESVRLAAEPSCVTVNTGGAGRLVLMKIAPLRPATHWLARIVNRTVASEFACVPGGTAIQNALPPADQAQV